jgi:alkaline phosphatase
MTGDRLTTTACLAIASLLLILMGLRATAAAAPAAASKKPTAKHIVVMVADGWAFDHVTAASYYRYGKLDRQVYNRFPFRFAMSTYMAYRKDRSCYGWGYDPLLAWKDFDYVRLCTTDSAAAATAMSTGVKTYGGAIGVDLSLQPLLHAIELAEQNGKATGVVSSVQWSHATPAAFVAHNVSRNRFAGIAQEMVHDSAVDVIMGCGHPWFGDSGEPLTDPDTFEYKYVGGEATWDALVAGTAGGDADGNAVDDPWTLIQARVEFRALMNGPTPTRVLGTAQVHRTLQQRRAGNRFADPYAVPPIDTVPTLEEMTRAAINVLDGDSDGFFLMVEGGAIDWASHRNESGRMIEEHIDFDNAVDAVMDWVRAHSNWGETLLIVTGDHETGYLTGPGSDPTWKPIVNNGAGHLPAMEWHSGSHTNSLIPLAAKGDSARAFRGLADKLDPVRGPYLDNTELAQVLFWALDPGHAGPIIAAPKTDTGVVRGPDR